MKKEELYRRKYESVASFMKAIESYIQFYNEKRPHAALNYKTPVQFEAEYENTEQQPWLFRTNRFGFIGFLTLL